ncbi:MAG TPA: hypothetical protein VN306_09310 [Mycobacterium sp.]|nr:hypothetical protein [Mycobacterium sp.]
MGDNQRRSLGGHGRGVVCVRARTFNGAGARTASDDLIRASEDGEAAFFEIANIETNVETAQFSEAMRAKLRNRLRLLMRKLEREETIQEVGNDLDTATDDELFKLIDDEFGT